MRRSVGFNVAPDGSVTPRIPQYGGVRGEHNATEFNMTLIGKAPYTVGDLVRLRFIDGNGAVLSSDLIEDYATDETRMALSYLLPDVLTHAGGQLSVRLVLSSVDDSGVETETFVSDEAVLYFDDAPSENGTPFWMGVSEMLKRTAAASDAAVAARDAARDEVQAAAADADRAETAAASAVENAVSAVTAKDEAEAACKNAQLYASAALSSRDVAVDKAEAIAASAAQIDANAQNIELNSGVIRQLLLNKLSKGGHTPNKYLGTDDNGDVVVTDAPEGGGGTGVGVASAVLNESGELVLTYTDGTADNVGTVVGEDGEDGADGTTQLVPLFANAVEECTDTEKLYVLPDGYIYAYMKTTQVIEGDPVPAFTNLKDACVYQYTKRYSMSGGAFSNNTTGTAVVIPVPSGSTSVVIRIKGVSLHGSYTAVYGGASATAFTETLTQHTPAETDSDGTLVYTTSKAATTTYIVMNFAETSASAFEDVIITVNEPIAYESGTEIVETEAFANTGHAFVPADYEERILALEDTAVDAAGQELRLAALEDKVGTVDEGAAVHGAVGTTFCPSQKPAVSTIDGYDLDIMASTADEVYAYIDAAVADKPTVTKEILGKDASGQYDVARYIFADREHMAWQKQGYPPMYAWQHGDTVIYSVSVSPRTGDTLYSTPYIGAAHGTVTDVNATNRSRTVDGVEYVRCAGCDARPTVMYTDADDERNGNAAITHDGATYVRYPLGDLGANKSRLTPIFIYANEHGTIKDPSTSTTHETKMCAIVAARLVRDLGGGKQESNPLYRYIREHCMLIVIPVANPYGFNYNLTADTNTGNSGYNNANNININRNYDTPGWTTAGWGAHAGSENETQYIMNTMAESGAVVAMSLHGLGGTSSNTRGQCKYQGQQPDGTGYNAEKIARISAFLNANYGYQLYNYDAGVAENMPDVTAKSPSYITQCGAYGGIIEFCPADSDKSLEGFVHEMKQKVIENAYAQVLNLTAMWLSDYLEATE